MCVIFSKNEHVEKTEHVETEQVRNRVPAARPRPGCRVAIGSPSTKQAESMELRLCAGGALAATPRWRLILSSCGSAFDTAATPRLSHGNVADMRWAMVYPVPVMRRPVTGRCGTGCDVVAKRCYPDSNHRAAVYYHGSWVFFLELQLRQRIHRGFQYGTSCDFVGFDEK